MSDCRPCFDSQLSLTGEGFTVHDVSCRGGEEALLLHAGTRAHVYWPRDCTIGETSGGRMRPWTPEHLELRPPGHAHVLRFSGDGRLLVVVVEPQRYAQLRPILGDWRIAAIPIALLHGIPQRMADAVQAADPVAPILVPALALELLAQAALVSRGASGAVIDRARELVRRNLGNPALTLQQIAADLRVSPRALARAFRASRGETLPEYALRARTEEALHLIATTSMALKEIAAHVGFYDQAHMCRHIKRHTGRTPREHRRA